MASIRPSWPPPTMPMVEPGPIIRALRRAVRRDDFRFVRNPKLTQQFARVAHCLPVGAAAHDDPDERLRHRPALKQLHKSSSFRGPIRGRQIWMDTWLTLVATP